MKPRLVLLTLTAAACAGCALLAPQREPVFCGERTRAGEPGSLGQPSNGSLIGAAEFVDSADARVLPLRHRRRCLAYGTPRLVRALHAAGAEVRGRIPESPPLGVGNLGRAGGGPIRCYSRSHQSGRDADLQFYLLDGNGRPVPPEDLYAVGPDLRGRGPDGSPRTLDVQRTWALVAALLEDRSIEVQWLFVSGPLKAALLDEARRQRAPDSLLARASEALHQPSDAPAHDDHLHLRIGCTAAEIHRGCTGGK